MSVGRVGVVGDGIMGSGIAEVCARASVEAAQQTSARIGASLERAVARGSSRPPRRRTPWTD